MELPRSSSWSSLGAPSELPRNSLRAPSELHPSSLGASSELLSELPRSSRGAPAELPRCSLRAPYELPWSSLGAPSELGRQNRAFPAFYLTLKHHLQSSETTFMINYTTHNDQSRDQAMGRRGQTLYMFFFSKIMNFRPPPPNLPNVPGYIFFKPSISVKMYKCTNRF